MVHHVSLQLQLPLELLTAGVAVVLHLVTVDSLVINHILLLSKALPASITYPGFLSCVNPPVELQLTLADEPSLAELTDPGLHPGGMGLALVGGHARLHGEVLATDITHVGPLAAMHPGKTRELNYQISWVISLLTLTLPQMSYQIGLPAETGLALITLVRLGVDLLVNSLVAGSAECFRTMLTFQSLRRVFPLHVTLQSLLRTELTGTPLTAIFLAGTR